MVDVVLHGHPPAVQRLMVGTADLSPCGVHAQEHAYGHGDVAGKDHFRKALLAVAVVQAVLHAPHLAVGDAVGGPGGKAYAVAGGLAQVGQVLQADALARLAMAGGAGEIMRAAALVEEALAHFVHGALLRMVLRQMKGHALGLRGNPGGQGRGVGALALAPLAVDDDLGVYALQRAHAGEQARFQVLHLAGVGKPARQLDEGALDHARPLAQIAAFQRRVLGAALLFPQLFALGLEQVGRVAVLQHLAVLLYGLYRCLLCQSQAR